MDKIFLFSLMLFTFTSGAFLVSKLISFYILVFHRAINDVPRDWVMRPKVSVMMSAFNEGRHVYESIKSIMSSDYPADCLEVVAFDDYSKDDTFEWMERIAAEYPSRVIVRRNPMNLGKSHTLLEISKLASGSLLLSTDSDIIFGPNAVKELVSCFADPDMGAVGAQCRIHNINDSYVTQMQTAIYMRIYYLYKAFENLGKTARCLTGQMVMFRRELYLEMMKHILTRNFLGSKVMYGEDTYLTQNIVMGIGGLNRGWKVFTNLKALGWTGTPATWKAYMNQQLRWRRGVLLHGIRAIQNFLPMTSSGNLISLFIFTMPFIACVATLMLGLWLIMIGSFLPAVVVTSILIFFSTLILAWVYNLTIARVDPYGKIASPTKAAIAFAMWFPVNVFWLSFFALLTLDDGGWVTRQNTGNIS